MNWSLSGKLIAAQLVKKFSIFL